MATPPVAVADLPPSGPASYARRLAVSTAAPRQARHCTLAHRRPGRHVDPCDPGVTPPSPPTPVVIARVPGPSLATAPWLEERRGELWPVEACPVVLTLPALWRPWPCQPTGRVHPPVPGRVAPLAAQRCWSPHLGARGGWLASATPGGNTSSPSPPAWRRAGGRRVPRRPALAAGRPGLLLPGRALSRCVAGCVWRACHGFLSTAGDRFTATCPFRRSPSRRSPAGPWSARAWVV